MDELTEGPAITTYDPETLLSQIIDKITGSQGTSSVESAEAQVDEVAVAEIAASRERLLVGLITLARKLIQTADSEVSSRVIQERNLIDLLFKQLLFRSYFQAQEEKKSGVVREVELVQRAGSKKGPKKVASNNRSREAAFSLLTELVKQSGQLMRDFL